MNVSTASKSHRLGMSIMHSDLLNSWKEIAAYLGRGVRTVQRWENDLHLPVHRPHQRRRSVVTALKSELDQWVRNGGRSTNGSLDSFADVAATTTTLKTKRREMRMLSTQLREQIHQTRELIHEARLVSSKLAFTLNRPKMTTRP